MITQRQLESILINEGIIDTAAIEDPEGYDGGRTELAITIATQQINELFSPDGTEPHPMITSEDITDLIQTCELVPSEDVTGRILDILSALNDRIDAIEMMAKRAKSDNYDP